MQCLQNCLILIWKVLKLCLIVDTHFDLCFFLYLIKIVFELSFPESCVVRITAWYSLFLSLEGRPIMGPLYIHLEMQLLFYIGVQKSARELFAWFFMFSVWFNGMIAGKFGLMLLVDRELSLNHQIILHVLIRRDEFLNLNHMGQFIVSA